MKVKILTENQYARFQNQIDALLAYLKVVYLKNKKLIQMQNNNLFYEFLFASRRIDKPFNKYRESLLLIDELNNLYVKYKILKINNREYIDLDNRYKILDSYLFNELSNKYILSNNDYSLKGVIHAIKKAYPLFLKNRFYLKLDIANFFPSIQLNLLFNKIKDFENICLLKRFLHFETKGLPLGLIVSSILCNLFLKDLDDKYDNYFRYVDDILIFDNNYYTLLEIKKQISTTLNSKKLTLNNTKTIISKTERLEYLGYIMTKSSIFPRENILVNFFEKLKKIDDLSIQSYKPWFITNLITQ